MLSLHVIILMHGGQTLRSIEALKVALKCFFFSTESLCMSFDSKISHPNRLTIRPT